ncbi:hypothetical protein ACP26L_12890 [Paenibacillus sp. S-38]|uniref:hypothetical protein n=1 Tax=Paenibacillus sp. S-38 TaxID=3416710 RepID=UPI003CF7CC9E
MIRGLIVFLHIVVGILLALFWLLTGFPLFLAGSLSFGFSMKYLFPFLFAVPLFSEIFSWVLFKRRDRDYRLAAVLFLVVTIGIVVLIPIAAE